MDGRRDGEGLRKNRQPAGASAGSSRSTSRLRSESAVSPRLYGSVTRLVTTRPADGANTVTWKAYRCPFQDGVPVTDHTPVVSSRRIAIVRPSRSRATRWAVGAHTETVGLPSRHTGPSS